MSETYYRVCPDGCDEGRVPVYGFNGLQTGDEPCETCQGSGYVALPADSVLLDATTAATAAEACEALADAMTIESATEGLHAITDKGRAIWNAAAKALRGEGA